MTAQSPFVLQKMVKSDTNINFIIILSRMFNVHKYSIPEMESPLPLASVLYRNGIWLGEAASTQYLQLSGRGIMFVSALSTLIYI